MAKDRSTVRASDIGAWAFCNRAWWLARVQQVPHRNLEQIAHGNASHARHGQRVRRSARLQQLARLLMALGVAAIVLLSLWAYFA